MTYNRHPGITYIMIVLASYLFTFIIDYFKTKWVTRPLTREYELLKSNIVLTTQLGKNNPLSQGWSIYRTVLDFQHLTVIVIVTGWKAKGDTNLSGEQFISIVRLATKRSRVRVSPTALLSTPWASRLRTPASVTKQYNLVLAEGQ